jgi:DNA-binding MarR family transcriptional regulator
MSNQSPASARAALSSAFVHWLRIVGERSEALVQKHLRPYGLSVSQGRLFGLVADLSLKGQAPLQKDLETDMRLVTSSITSLIQGLERRGLLARVGSVRDGRAKELHITAEGWKVYKELGQRVPLWHRSLTDPLSDPELSTLVRLLQKLAAESG